MWAFQTPVLFSSPSAGAEGGHGGLVGALAWVPMWLPRRKTSYYAIYKTGSLGPHALTGVFAAPAAAMEATFGVLISMLAQIPVGPKEIKAVR